MKKRTYRLLCILASTVLLVTGALTGCGGSGKSGVSKGDGTQQTEENGAEEKKAPKIDGLKYQKTMQLKYATGFDVYYYKGGSQPALCHAHSACQESAPAISGLHYPRFHHVVQDIKLSLFCLFKIICADKVTPFYREEEINCVKYLIKITYSQFSLVILQKNLNI